MTPFRSMSLTIISLLAQYRRELIRTDLASYCDHGLKLTSDQRGQGISDSFHLVRAQSWVYRSRTKAV